MAHSYKCLKDYEGLNVKKGEEIRMSEDSERELDEDERFIGWRKYFEIIKE